MFFGLPKCFVVCNERVVVKKRVKARPSVTKGPAPTFGSLAFPLLRVFLLAMVGVVASAYGLWRYYAVPRPSMRAKAPMHAPSEPPPNEIPIEIE